MNQPALLDVDPHVRRDEDFYPTPAFMTRALLKRLPSLQGLTVLEPCAGNGAIVDVLPADARIVTNDIAVRDPFVPDFLVDATQRRSWLDFHRAWPVDVTATNPPFDVAFPILQHAFEFSRRGVVLLLRLTFLEPTEDRGPWLAEHPPDRLIVLPRYDFRGNGKTDSVSTAWMIWNTDAQQPLAQRGVDVVTKAERDELMRAA